MRSIMSVAAVVTALSAGPALAEERPAVVASGLNETEIQSIGCIATGSAATLAATLVGPTEIIALIGGSATILLPSSPLVAATAVGALVFASFCSVGQAAAPAAVLAYTVAGEQLQANGWDTWAQDRWMEARGLDATGTVRAVAAAATDAVTGVWGVASQTVATAMGYPPSDVPLVYDDDVRMAQVVLGGAADHPSVH